MSAKHIPSDAPQSLGAIEMEDVRQLVSDDELAPVIVVAKLSGADWRVCKDDDAI